MGDYYQIRTDENIRICDRYVENGEIVIAVANGGRITLGKFLAKVLYPELNQRKRDKRKNK